MRLLLYILFLLLPFTGCAQFLLGEPGILKASAAAAHVVYQRSLTIDHTKCGSGNSTNFTVLVSLSDATLKTVANGGHVYRSDGNDIRFFSTDTTSLLSYAIELYDGTAGTLLAWVKLPTVSSSVNTVFYMNYGSPVVSTFQGGALGTAWDNALGVYFMNEATGSNLTDQSGNANTGTQHGSPVQSTGQIGYAESMSSASSQYYDCGTFTSLDGIAHMTMISWMKRTATNKSLLMTKGSVGGRYCGIEPYSDGQVYYLVNSAFATTADNTTTWHMYTMAYDGTQSTNNAKVHTYFDNTDLALGWSGTVPSTTPSTLGHLYVGRDNGLNENQNGLTDFTIIYSVTRGPDWITTMYNNINAPGNIGSANFLTASSETS